MNARHAWETFIGFALRVVIAHWVTYFIFGLVMSNVFNYGNVFKADIIRDFMLPIDQHNVLLGPFLQPVRGILFAVGLWPVRSLLVEKKRGWLILWGLLVTVGILSTPAAAPSSLEGVLYSRLPLWYHLMGLPEILLQTLAFSIWVVWWERQIVSQQDPAAPRRGQLAAEGIKALVTGLFAYIGYAAGGLLMVVIVNANSAASGSAPVDVAAAGQNFKMQFMFVVALIVNTVAVGWAARRWQARRIRLGTLFLVFWGLDALVPWLYQMIVFGSSFIPTVILLGFLPALIIVFSIRLNYPRTDINLKKVV